MGLGFLIIGFVMSIYILFIVVCIAGIVYALIQYFFESIFLYNAMKRKNYKYPITSWIPFYNKVNLGKISQNEKCGWLVFIFALLNISLIVLFFALKDVPDFLNTIMFFVIIILVLLNFVLNIYLSYTIIKKVTSKFVDLLTLLNVFTLGFSRPIVLFIIRNNNKI